MQPFLLIGMLLTLVSIILLFILSRPPRREVPTLSYFQRKHAWHGLEGLRRLPFTPLTLTTLLLILLTSISLVNPTIHHAFLPPVIILDQTPSMPSIPPPVYGTLIRMDNLDDGLLTSLPAAEGRPVLLITDGRSRLNPLLWNLLRSRASAARVKIIQNPVEENVGIVNATLTTMLTLTLLNTHHAAWNGTLTIKTQNSTLTKEVLLPAQSLTTISLPPPVAETRYTLTRDGYAFDDQLRIIPPRRNAVILGQPSRAVRAALAAFNITLQGVGSIQLPGEAGLIILNNATPAAFLPSTKDEILQTVRNGGSLISFCTPPDQLPPELNPYLTLKTRASRILLQPDGMLPLPRLPAAWQGRLKPGGETIATLNGTPIISSMPFGKGKILTILPCADDLAYTPSIPLLIRTALESPLFHTHYEENPLSLEESLPTRKLPRLLEKQPVTPYTSLYPFLLLLILIPHAFLLARRAPLPKLIPSLIIILLIILLSNATIQRDTPLPRENITLLDTSLRMLLTQPPNLTITNQAPLTSYENLTPYLQPNANLTIISTGHLDGTPSLIKRIAEREHISITPLTPDVLITDYAIRINAPAQTIQNTTTLTLLLNANKPDTTRLPVTLTVGNESWTLNLTPGEQEQLTIPLRETYTIIKADLDVTDGLEENNHAVRLITRIPPPRVRILGNDTPLARIAAEAGQPVTEDPADAYLITTPQSERMQAYLLQQAAEGASLILTPEAAGSWKILPAMWSTTTRATGRTPVVILLIDISGSSLQPTNETANITRLVQAKAIAASIASQLPEESLISLITFNTRASTIIPLREKKRVPLLIGTIYTLPAYGGTSIATGLRAAADQLEGHEGGRVILLTDGYSSTPTADVQAARSLRGKGSLIIIPLTDQPNLAHLERIAHAADGILTNYTPTAYKLILREEDVNATGYRLIRTRPSKLIPKQPEGSVERVIPYQPAAWADTLISTTSGLPVLITSTWGAGRISLITTPSTQPGSLAGEDAWIIANLLASHGHPKACTLREQGEAYALTCPKNTPLPSNYTRLSRTPRAWTAILPAGVNVTINTTPPTPIITDYPRSISYTQNTRLYEQLTLSTPPRTQQVKEHPPWAYVLILILLTIDLAWRRKQHLHP